jgi:hypothetical protein
MSYALGWSETGTVAKKDFLTSCAICRLPLKKGELISDQEIHKCGEFQYFNLAHTECVCKEKHGCSFCDYDEAAARCSTLS